MFLIRDIMYCQPGKARPMVEKFKALARLSEGMGLGKMRVMTDFCAERYWMVVSETEVPSLEEYSEQSRKTMEIPEFRDAMQGYHELLASGRREIYVIEG